MRRVHGQRPAASPARGRAARPAADPMKFPATPTAALVAQNGTRGSAATSEPGSEEGDGRMPSAEAGRVREHVAGLEQNLRLDGRQVVRQRLRSAAERAAVVGGHHGLQTGGRCRRLLLRREAADRERVPALGRIFERLRWRQRRSSSRRTHCRSRPGPAASAHPTRRAIQRVARHRSRRNLVERSAPARRPAGREVGGRGGQAEAAQRLSGCSASTNATAPWVTTP